MKKKDLEKLIVRGSNVLVVLKLKQLSSGLIMVSGEEVDQDRYDVFVLKTGPDVKDIKAGDQVFLANVAIDALRIEDGDKDEIVGYTPESFVKMYLRNENTH